MKLGSGQITAANHSGIIRYTFPSADRLDSHILVDLTHVLPGFGSQDYTQKWSGGEIHIADDAKSYHGRAAYTGGWAQAPIHTLFFCANFSNEQPNSKQPLSRTFSWPYYPFAIPSKPALRTYKSLVASNNMGIGAVFTWPSSYSNSSSASLVIGSRIGISYLSSEKACSHISAELPLSQTFENTVNLAKKEWNEKVLGRIRVQSDNATLKRMLYTGLYQTGLLPTDKTGENPGWDSGERECSSLSLNSRARTLTVAVYQSILRRFLSVIFSSVYYKFDPRRLLFPRHHSSL